MKFEPRDIEKRYTGFFGGSKSETCNNHRELHVFVNIIVCAHYEVKHTSEEVIAMNFPSKITVEKRFDEKKPSNK